MRRREFITLLGGAAFGWPLAVSGQEPARPVIGFLSGTSLHLYADRLRAFRQGLKELGYVEDDNVAIEYRWAEGQNDWLPALADQLVYRRVAVIVAGGGTPSALVANAATTTIPIVFGVAVDPVALGLVASLNRPGGNVTGVTNLTIEVAPKRPELLREVLPSANIIAVLVNPASPSIAEPFLRSLQAAARTLHLQLRVLNASTEHDFEKVFAAFIKLRADALVIGPDAVFNAYSEQLARLTVHHTVPAIFHYRQFAAAGGLLSYGPSETEYYRLLGKLAGKILKGGKPSELPVQQSTKVELIINLQTAKTLGLTIPQSLLVRADEIIQ